MCDASNLKNWSAKTENDPFKVLVGLTLKDVRETNDELHFEFECGRTMLMYHYQDCCENVYLEDTSGDWEDIKGSPLLVAEERTSDEKEGEWGDVQMYTFYTFRTIKGTVDLRWNGSSNGYYSIGVSVALSQAPEELS